MHKIRLIGVTEEASSSAFESAVRKHWKRGVSETDNFEGSWQIECVGQPWRPRTTEENIESAELICGILRELWSLGWRWYCAIDMSVSTKFKTLNSMFDKPGQSSFHLFSSKTVLFQHDQSSYQGFVTLSGKVSTIIGPN